MSESKKREENGGDDNDSNQTNHDHLHIEYIEFIKEEIEVAIENNKLDVLLPAPLLAATKEKFKS